MRLIRKLQPIGIPRSRYSNYLKTVALLDNATEKRQLHIKTKYIPPEHTDGVIRRPFIYFDR